MIGLGASPKFWVGTKGRRFTPCIGPAVCEVTKRSDGVEDTVAI